MPWKSGAEFAKKHNKKLHGAAANKAKSIAEAMIGKGVDEGVAIATANKRAKGKSRPSGKNPFKIATEGKGGY